MRNALSIATRRPRDRFPCRRGAPPRSTRTGYLGFVGQDPPCVAFATADVPERQTQRRASNTHPQSQSTPTDRARGLPYRLVSPESRHAIADTWLEKLNSTERASGSPFAIFSVRPSILRQRDLVAIQSPCASQ